MTYYYKDYSFSAFGAGDIGGALYKGATFHMPSSPTQTITIRDDDGFLSGDSRYNEQADDWSGQHASIRDANGHEIGNGTKAYAETVWTLRGSDGNTYQVVEIEQSGSLPDSYTFYNGGPNFYGTPPAGVTLTAVSCSNVTSNYLDYKCFDATPPAPPVPTQYCIEAEDMWETGFHVASGSNASGGKFLKLNCAGGNGDASANFGGVSGCYDLTLRIQDENDGQSTIMVKVNGVVVGTINLDRDTDGRGSDHGGFSDFTLKGLDINSGDKISLWVDGDHGEYVRIDKLTFDPKPAGPVFRDCTDPNAVNVDFEALSAGDVVSMQYTDLMISAQRSGQNNDARNDAMVFDSSNPTGGDTDLATSSQGNILIISEDNDSSDPDDALGGSVEFKFTNPSFIYDLKIVDTEEGGTIDLFDANGNSLGSIAIPRIANGAIDQVLIDTDGVARMVVTLNGSGAIDDLCYVPGQPPAPGSLSGRYFCDDNKNGIDDGEAGVAGVTVELLDAAGNGTGITTVTDANGNYSFGNLAPGTYGVKFTDTVSGKTLIAADQGSDDSIDSDATDLGNGMSQITGITVVSGQDTPDNDAGVEDPGTASISGTYFCDENDNDVQDPGEATLAGQTVWLIEAGVGIVASTTTDANGNYSFTGLDAGKYCVRFDGNNNGGKEFVAGNVGGDDTIDSDVVNVGGAGNGNTAKFDLAIGENKTDVDAGVEDPGTASLSGRVFCDDNNNDVDDSEPGVGGVTVTLLTAAGAVVATATTAADGSYSFTGLDAGDYKVSFDESTAGGKTLVGQDAGTDDTVDSDADASGMTGTYTLNIGDNVTDVDAGVETVPGSLSGRYFCDDNNNGVDDGEPGVAGVTVELLDAAGNGTGVTTTTAADGSYSFGNLAPGSYGVKFTDTVSGKTLIAADQGSDDSIDSDATDLGNGMSQITGITVVAGQDTPDNDAGVEEQPGSLSGTYFCDDNDNGADDAGDTDVAGKTVTLLNVDGTPATDIDGNPVAPVQTDAQGNYSFGNLAAGDYKVMFEDSSAEGKVFIAQDAGNDDTDDSDVDPNTGMTGPVTVTAGNNTPDVDAGVVTPAPVVGSLSGRYFCDENRDGVDNGEPGVAGVTVELLDAAGNGTGVTTTTAADGSYSFGNLAPGSYGVKFTDTVSGKTLVATDVGTDDTIDSDASDLGNGMSQITGITVVAGQDTPDNDAGVETVPGSLSGRYFCDDNNNGVDDGEPGVAGVTVELLDAAGNGTGVTTTTAADGSYSFGNLAPGSYGVKFTDTVSGKTLIAADQGSDDSIDSDATDLGNGMSQITGITVVAGQDTPDNDAGVETVPGSLSGRYFCDENRDGVDNGEPGVAGVTVELLDAAGNGTGVTTTTAADGSYSFGNLAPGSYGVKFTDTVSGKTLIAANQGSDDSIDSDASDLGNGMSQITGITVVAGQDTPDNDAGVETVNGDPTPAPDAGKVCVEDGGTFNVLANDMDPDGDTLSVLTIADADETVGVGGTLTLASGATATLNADGTITYDGTTGSNAGLLVGQEAAEEQITYTVSDGNGGTGSSTLDITACGSTSTLQMICDSLPAQIDLSISLTGTPLDYEITVFDGAGTADDKLASAIWNGFCIDINGTLLLDQTLTANVYTSCDPIPAGLIANPGNLDNIEWLINQDLNGASNKAGTDTYDVFDLQEAVWILSDGTASTNADANEIAQMALAMGDGFVAQDGDKVAVIFDPIAPAGSGVTDTQTFIMGVDWDAIELDCIC